MAAQLFLPHVHRDGNHGYKLRGGLGNAYVHSPMGGDNGFRLSLQLRSSIITAEMPYKPSVTFS